MSDEAPRLQAQKMVSVLREGKEKHRRFLDRLPSQSKE